MSTHTTALFFLRRLHSSSVPSLSSPMHIWQYKTGVYPSLIRLDSTANEGSKESTDVAPSLEVDIDHAPAGCHVPKMQEERCNVEACSVNCAGQGRPFTPRVVTPPPP